MSDVVDFPLFCGRRSADKAALIAPSSPVVRQHARIGDTHQPCGTPVLMSTILSLLPSRQTTLRRSRKNESTHLTVGKGILNSRRRFIRTGWDTLLKNPTCQMSTLTWTMSSDGSGTRDDSMSCNIAREMSSADLLLTPPD